MNHSGATKIKGVILDYGEVLSHPPTAGEWDRMASLFQVDRAQFRPLWDRNRLLYDRGDLSLEAYWAQLAEDARLKLEPEQLRKLSQWDVEMWAHINTTMVEWLKQMRSSGVKTGLLSNMPGDMIRYARQQFAWLKDFDHQTFSAEVGLVKPDPAIYRHSLDGLGVEASEALFVDDKAQNIEGARAAGMFAIQFRSTTQLRDDLEKLGFPILPVESTPFSPASRAR
jgi:putative hydrolase of the HAD superfamily